MANFPLLKTGALAQYPLERGTRYRTEVVRYVDGGEQRYREWNGVLRRWVVRLELLEEREVAEIEEFFRGEQGQAGTFVFTDPFSGAEYPQCYLEGEELRVAVDGEMRSRTELVIRELRG